MDVQPFALGDCGMVCCATGRTCSNLREFLGAVRIVPDTVLEHHMMRCALEDYFDLHEFPNDFARWCWLALGDHALGEALSLVDPYRYPTMAELRLELVDVIEDRLWNLDRLPRCRPGRELHLADSRLVTYDTGLRFRTPVALAEGIDRMELNSLFYHVHEARRRTGGRSDDFSQWLEDYGAPPELVARLRAVDFLFLNLNQLRREFLCTLGEYLLQPAMAVR